MLHVFGQVVGMGDGREVEPLVFLGAVAGDVLEPGVDAQEFAAKADMGDAHSGLLEGAPEAAFGSG